MMTKDELEAEAAPILGDFTKLDLQRLKELFTVCTY
jgi:hypothetical protein